MTILTSKLIVALVDQVTAPSRAVSAAINRMTVASQANAARMAEVRGKMLDATAAGWALWRGLSAPVNAAMQFESAMADVRKVVDFPTPEAFQEMGDDIRRLSTEMPMAADGIAAIVAAAGQSGLAVDELLPFAEMAAKVGVAWEVSADNAGEALAKLKTALGMSVAETGLLADAINHLGNNTAASAPDILDVVRRVGAQASQFGLSAEQAAAFGAAMVGAGAESEVAATSFRNMGRALTRGASATKRQSAAYKTLGLDAQKVAADMQRDAVGTITNVLERIRAVPAEARAALITDLFGDEARAIGPLITNTELLADALGLVANRAEYAGSAAEEYAIRAKTSENNLQLFRNQITSLAISIGNALLPAMNQILAVVGPIVTSISDLAQRFPNVTAGIVGLTAAAIAFKVAAIGIQYGALLAKGGLIDMGIAVLSAGRSLAGLALAPIIAGFTALRTAMVGFLAVGAVAGPGAAFSQLGASLLGLLNPIRLVSAAFTALKLALVSTGIGAIVVGLAMAGTWIYNNWSNLAAMFKGFGDAFMLAISPIRPALDPVIEGVSSLIGWIVDLVGPIEGAEQSFGAFGVAAGRAVGKAVMAVLELPGKVVAFAGEMYDAGVTLFQSMFDGIRSKIETAGDFLSAIPAKVSALASEMYEAGRALGQAIYDGVVSLVSQLADYIRSTLSSAISSAGAAARNLASKLTFGLVGGGGDDAPALAGARASGGPVKAGGSYLVGEEGPEIVTFGQDGFVHDAMKTARIIRNAALGAAGMAFPAAAMPAIPEIPTIEIAIPEVRLPVPPQLPATHQAQEGGQSGGRGVEVSVAAGAIKIEVTAAAGQSPERVAEEVERRLSAKLTTLYNGAFHDGVN